VPGLFHFRFGTNSLPEPPHKTYLQLLFDAMKDTTMVILLVAAVVSLALAFLNVSADSPCADFDPDKANRDEEKSSAEYIESIAIIVAVVLVSNVAAMNDYSKEKQFQKLSEASRNTAIVQVPFIFYLFY
jgi:magnesium-transporting ATPase (P-type)